LKDLKVVEYNGKRILTTAQLAQFYKTDIDIISQNYNRNKDRYVIGKHYFFLEKDELKKFKISNPLGEGQLKQAPSLCLWTFDGCIIHYNNVRSASPLMLVQLADYFGIDAETLAIVKHQCQEGVLGEQLKNLLQGVCPIIPQFAVDGYRVDFYLPTISIVIEYDEQHHRQQPKKDSQRQKYIEDRLGCKFIRVHNGYDFSLIANKIMIALLKLKR